MSVNGKGQKDNVKMTAFKNNAIFNWDPIDGIQSALDELSHMRTEAIERKEGVLPGSAGKSNVSLATQQLKQFISNNSKIILEPPNLERLVIIAIYNDNADILSHLLGLGRRINMKTFADEFSNANPGFFSICNPLQAVVAQDRPNCLNTVLNHMNMTDRIATKDDLRELQDSMIDSNDLYITPLEFLFERGDPKFLDRVLTKNNLNELLFDNGTKTPLMYALSKENFKLANWLLDRPGIKLSIKNGNDEDVFTYFAKAGGAKIRKAVQDKQPLPKRDPEKIDDGVDLEIEKRTFYKKLNELVKIEDIDEIKSSHDEEFKKMKSELKDIHALNVTWQQSKQAKDAEQRWKREQEASKQKTPAKTETKEIQKPGVPNKGVTASKETPKTGKPTSFETKEAPKRSPK